MKKRITILTLTLSHGAVDFYVGLLAVVAPGLAQYLNIPIGDVVFLVGFAALANNLAQLPVGYIMGKRNMAWILPVAVLMASAPVFMGFAPGLPGLYALVVLGAIGTGVFHPEAALAAQDEAGEHSHMGIPIFMAGGAAIYAIGTPLSIKWTAWFGFSALAWFALPGILLGLLLLSQYRTLKRKHPSIVLRPRSKRVTKVQEGHMSYWPLLAVVICCSIANGVFVSTLSSHYELRFGPEARVWAGWVLMVWGISGAMASFVWTAMGKKYGMYRIVLVSQIVSAPLFLLLAWPASPVVGFFTALPFAFISPGAIFPVAVGMARNAAGLTQSLRTSITIGGTSALSAIAIMTGGRLLRGGMSSSFLLVTCAACSLVAVGLAIWQIATAKQDRAHGK